MFYCYGVPFQITHHNIMCNKHEIDYWFLWVTHTDVFTSKYYIQILYYMMDIYEWNLNMQLQMNYLQKNNWAFAEVLACD